MPDALISISEANAKKWAYIGLGSYHGCIAPGSSFIAGSKPEKKVNLLVCSIFVNPTQFNDPTDFEKYPVTIEKDILLLEKNGVDILFLPSVRKFILREPNHPRTL